MNLLEVSSHLTGTTIKDDVYFRKTLKELLERENHSITEAIDGREGFDLVQKTSFDLIISDILMPEQDGLGLLNKLKKVPNKPKIIMISGGSSNLQAGRFLACTKNLGADSLVEKPFDKKKILSTIDELLGL